MSKPMTISLPKNSSARRKREKGQQDLAWRKKLKIFYMLPKIDVVMTPARISSGKLRRIKTAAWPSRPLDKVYRRLSISRRLAMNKRPTKFQTVNSNAKHAVIRASLARRILRSTAKLKSIDLKLKSWLSPIMMKKTACSVKEINKNLKLTKLKYHHIPLTGQTNF